MPAAQPLSLDALRRLIAENDYWNPHSAQHQELQRKVSEGFGHLYPANHPSETDQPIRERNRLDVRDQYVRDLQQRYLESMKEYEDSVKSNVPTVPEYDEEGRMVKDYVPIPPEALEHQRQLNREHRWMEDFLGRLNALPGIERRLND